MDLVHSKEQEFIAASTFAGGWAGYIFQLGSHGLGYYRDGSHAKKRPRPTQMPPPPPQQPLEPSPHELQPPPAAPLLPANPTSLGFWEELREFEHGLDAGSAGSTASAQPQPQQSPQLPLSPPARLPARGTTEMLHWSGKRTRAMPKPRKPHVWPLKGTVPPITPKTAALAAPSRLPSQIAAASTVAPSQGPPPAAPPQICIDSLFAEWTNGTLPGSAEWIQALRARGAPKPQWWSTGLHFENIG
mmetsp:Transcript_26652/g.67771  ORF Transcript_26652/g.67771 Transcript_26652/m.67771 type:complete len:245 (+) Transcript_26652:285-1019(+)